MSTPGNSCNYIIKNINSKLIKIRSGISELTNKTMKKLIKYQKRVNKLEKTIKNPNTRTKRIMHLEKQTQKNITKYKHEFVLAQCKIIDSINKLKSKFSENQCNPSKLKPIHINSKNINTMNTLFTPEEQMILYNDLL